MSITKDLQVFSFFQIEIETTIGDSVKDMFTKDELKKIDLNKKIKVRNNDSIITPDNWHEYKDVFFNQRMSKYKASYTESEKIKLELEDLNKLTISSPDYKILKKRYKKYLKALLNIELPQQTEPKKDDKVKGSTFELLENNFDNVEPIKVINHFKQLVTNGYITQSNFELFLKTNFIEKQMLKSKIEIIKSNSKERVRKIFYKYYETYVSQKYGNQKKYIELLHNNFTGFNLNSLKTNFSK